MPVGSNLMLAVEKLCCVWASGSAAEACTVAASWFWRTDRRLLVGVISGWSMLPICNVLFTRHELLWNCASAVAGRTVAEEKEPDERRLPADCVEASACAKVRRSSKTYQSYQHIQLRCLCSQPSDAFSSASNAWAASLIILRVGFFRLMGAKACPIPDA